MAKVALKSMVDENTKDFRNCSSPALGGAVNLNIRVVIGAAAAAAAGAAFAAAAAAFPGGQNQPFLHFDDDDSLATLQPIVNFTDQSQFACYATAEVAAAATAATAATDTAGAASDIAGAAGSIKRPKCACSRR
jgi:hypothetical protein